MKLGETELSLHTVIITLVDVSKQVREDSEAARLTDLVKRDVLVNCCSAQTFWTSGSTNSEEVERMQKQVLRYMQTKDKYASFSSALLKSIAFHAIHDTTDRLSPNLQHRHLVVELPRTEFGKPYIPMQVNEQISNNNIEEDKLFPLSVSHQFPYVGSARLDVATNSMQNDSMTPPPKVGMDIVMFEDYNRRLYSNINQFINVFQSSFTEWEWNRIHSRKATHVYELYVRWAMKEAYTKALGVGLGFEFNSFDIKLKLLDDEDNDTGLWPTISASSEGLSIFGSVISQQSKSIEAWDFYFLPLDEREIQQKNSSSYSVPGCLCLCLGPFVPSQDSDHSNIRYQAKREWMKFEDLVAWHG